MIFNSSFVTGVVPDGWRIITITALFKKGDNKYASNYRPVNLHLTLALFLFLIIRTRIGQAKKFILLRLFQITQSRNLWQFQITQSRNLWPNLWPHSCLTFITGYRNLVYRHFPGTFSHGKFSGTRFKRQYTTTRHLPTLKNSVIWKLNHSAEKCISGLALTSANYEQR